MTPKTLALLVFAAAYLLFVLWPARRTWTALGGAGLIVLTRALTPAQVVAAINWNVMGIFVGTLVLADLFIESRMPAYLAERLVRRSRSTRAAMVSICLLAGLISAFVENVATVMIIAPIALSLADKLKLSPVRLLIAIAISSNLQGAATLVGDPPSMLLAGFARMNFMDFFVYRGRLSVFFAVQAGALASLVYLFWCFRAHRGRASVPAAERIRTWVPTGLLALLIAGLAAASLFDTEFSYLAGLMCLVLALAGIAWDIARNRGPFIDRIKGLDWDTTVFLAGVFVLVGSLTETGWTDTLADGLAGLIGHRLLYGYVFLIVLAMLISAFVDNVPFLAAMLPVCLKLAGRLAVDPTLFLFALLLGASIGGNITPIGASANIVTMGLLRKAGHPARFGTFTRMGLPFSIVAVAAAGLVVWLVWA